MTAGALAGVFFGLALGVLGPRAGRPLLAGLAALLGTLFVVWRAGAGQWSFLATALVLLPLLAAGVALVVRWPRLGLVLALPVVFGLGVLPVLLADGNRPGPAGMAGGVLCLALGVWGILRPALGIRFTSAAVGARWVLWALPGETAPWQWPCLALLLFLVGHLAAPRTALGRGRWGQALRYAAAGGLVALLLLAAAALFTPGLSQPEAGGAHRLERLQALAPRGGYLWPTLSETVVWEDADGYRAWDNLNVRYLSGSAERGPRRLPGSSPLLGRFSLNREVEQLRAVKDASELRDLQAAAHAIVSAVRAVAPGRTPGVSEQATAEAVRSAARAAGCTEDSFPPVVASGARAASIHASPSAAPLLVGQLVVVDVGCSVNHYASDFTRTFPVGGHFTADSRRYYEAVYAAQQAAVAACRPGAFLSGRAAETPSLDEVAHRVLRERLGLAGYSHGLGHGVGLFVHDGGTQRPLREGMVLTIEPGLYLPGKLGIRIEDTYRVTANGCEPLTTGLSAEAGAVEAFLTGLSEAR
jgi:hypothetical protein